MTFSDLEIKAIRRKLNLSQTAFGKLLGVGLRAVQNWEGGQRNISETAAILLQKIIEYEYAPQAEELDNIIIVTNTSKANGHRKAKFEKILDKLSIDEIVTYIHEHEKTRDFYNNPTYKMFLEIRMQRKIIEQHENETGQQKEQ